MEEIATVYARSLFEAAEDADKLDDVRDQLGEITDALSEDRDLQVFFFSPYLTTEEKKDGLHKAITDAVGSMLLVARNRNAEDNREAIQLTIPYIALLNFITNQQPHDKSAVKTEFVLATSQGFDETNDPEVVFLSNRHPLIGRGAAAGTRVYRDAARASSDAWVDETTTEGPPIGARPATSGKSSSGRDAS